MLFGKRRDEPEALAGAGGEVQAAEVAGSPAGVVAPDCGDTPVAERLFASPQGIGRIAGAHHDGALGREPPGDQCRGVQLMVGVNQHHSGRRGGGGGEGGFSSRYRPQSVPGLAVGRVIARELVSRELVSRELAVGSRGVGSSAGGGRASFGTTGSSPRACRGTGAVA